MPVPFKGGNVAGGYSMTEANKPDTGISERVYINTQKHTPRIIDYIRTSLPTIATKGVSCGTSTHIDDLCLYISTHNNITYSKVYPALRRIGYNSIYNNDGVNVNLLYELSDLVNRSNLALNTSVLYTNILNSVISDVSIFTCVIDHQEYNDIIKYVNNYNIRISNLNMYHVMLGIRELVGNGSEYNRLKDSKLYKDVLSHLNNFETVIQNKMFDIRHYDIKCYDRERVCYSYDEKFIQINIDISSIGLEFIEYEHQMNIGRVDILCKSDDGFVLVEVKKGIAGTDAIGQVLKYVCTFKGRCKGMIIAEGFNDKVIIAANDLHIDLVKCVVSIDDDMKQSVKIHRL